jgi:hypothetical protein
LQSVWASGLGQADARLLTIGELDAGRLIARRDWASVGQSL